MYFVQGYWFDPGTGHVFDEDFNVQPFTFAPPHGYNPFSYATRETAEKVERFLAALCSGPVKTEILLEGNPPYWAVRVTQDAATSTHNAGLVASALMRNYKGNSAAIKYELNRAGIT